MMTPHRLPVTGNLERLAGGATWSEGPLWLPAHQSLIWSDIPGNRILSWSQSGPGVWREDVEFTNGRCWWGDRLVQCSHGRRAVEIDDDGVITTVVDRYRHTRLNSPNDVAAHPDGSLWFTDPPYGIVQSNEGHPGELEYGACYVFRFHNGTLTPVVTDIVRPNGLAFSPDGATLYVSDTSAALGDGPDHCIRSYHLTFSGTDVELGPAHLFAVVEPGVPDGMTVDVEGRVWTSSGSGVQVYSPTGDLLGLIAVPEVVANVCFGGPDGSDLFIAATTSLYRIGTSTAGLG